MNWKPWALTSCLDLPLMYWRNQDWFEKGILACAPLGEILIGLAKWGVPLSPVCMQDLTTD